MISSEFLHLQTPHSGPTLIQLLDYWRKIQEQTSKNITVTEKNIGEENSKERTAKKESETSPCFFSVLQTGQGRR